jgi:hypothetical protein
MMELTKPFLAVCAGILFLPLVAAGSNQSTYLRGYLELNDAEQLRKTGDFLGAIAELKDALHCLELLRARDPNWEQELVRRRFEEVDDEVKLLEPLARRQVVREFREAGSADVVMSRLLEEGHRLEAGRDELGALKVFERYVTTAEAGHDVDSNWKATSIEEAQAAVRRLEAVVGAELGPTPHQDQENTFQ